MKPKDFIIAFFIILILIALIQYFIKLQPVSLGIISFLIGVGLADIFKKVKLNRESPLKKPSN